MRHLTSSDTQTVPVGDFALECGTVLSDVEIAYRTWGKPAKCAILICHALTGSADADDWWPGLLGPGKALDPDHDFILCSNVLGGCYGTTGPASISPQTGRAYQADFPPVTIRDIVHLQARLLDALGIEELELVTGGSMGGMQALEWGLLYPDRVRGLAPIAISGRHSPWCIALSEAQRHAIAADARWRDGFYPPGRGPREGLAAARMVAICSYRSWASFEQRFGREERDPELFQVASYLRYQGAKLVDRFDANTYITLTHSMDSHDVARGRGDYAETLRSLRHPSLVVSVSSDLLYPPAEQEELCSLMPGARLATIDSPHGHDAFLIELDKLDRMLADFREQLRAGAATPKVTSSAARGRP